MYNPQSLENFGDKPVEGYISAIVTSFEHLQKAMLNLRINESCGYSMFGIKNGIICNFLTFLRGTTYRAEMEYPVARVIKGDKGITQVQLLCQSFYLLNCIWWSIITGMCPEELALLEPGPVCHSRRLTLANRIMRLYVSTIQRYYMYNEMLSGLILKILCWVCLLIQIMLFV